MPLRMAGPQVRCRCRDREVRAYLSRLSGPLLDRIDLQVEVGRVATDDLLGDVSPAESESAHVRSRVLAARERGARRFTMNRTGPVQPWPRLDGGEAESVD
jgi:magnesium chelatase family protein